LQAKGDTCSVCDDEGSDVAQIAIGPPMAIALIKLNIFSWFSTLRLQVDFKSTGNFPGTSEEFPVAFGAASY